MGLSSPAIVTGLGLQVAEAERLLHCSDRELQLPTWLLALQMSGACWHSQRTEAASYQYLMVLQAVLAP